MATPMQSMGRREEVRVRKRRREEERGMEAVEDIKIEERMEGPNGTKSWMERMRVE